MQHEYCAEIALAEGETLPGTAEEVDVWIMLEYLPSWSAKATTDNSLAPATRAWLEGLSDAVAARGLEATPAVDPPPGTRPCRRDLDDRRRQRIALGRSGGLRRIGNTLARRCARGRTADGTPLFRLHQRQTRSVLRALRAADVRGAARAGW